MMLPMLIVCMFCALVDSAALDKGVQNLNDAKNAHLSPLSAIALDAEQPGLSSGFEQASRLISILEQDLDNCILSESNSIEPLSNGESSNGLTSAQQYSAEPYSEGEFERQNNQVQSLILQVRSLAANMENTIRELNTNGRLVTASIMKSMLNNVRRVENNLERFQVRVQTLQGTAKPNSASGQSANMSAQVNQILGPIRDRLNKLNDEITQLMNRIRSNVTPGSQSASALQPAVTSVLKPITG